MGGKLGMPIKKPSSCSGCPLYAPPWGKPDGFVPAHGSGDNGVLMVLEAAGKNEEEEGIPVVGPAGHFLFSQLARVGIEREGFRIHNTLSCHTPENRLVRMPYEAAAMTHCAPNLDATIADMQERCKRNGKHLTILTLGRIAFKRIMGYDDHHPIMKESYLCYPHWSEKYEAFVVAADHPSHVMQGNHHLVPVLQFAVKRALEIAANGLEWDQPSYVIDPTPETFGRWTQEYLAWIQEHPDTYLSYDIETPSKQGKNEDEISAGEVGDDDIILRCSFCYQPGDAVSVPWQAQFMPSIEALLTAPRGVLTGWNSYTFDDTKVSAQFPAMNSTTDGMLAWHVLNSTLPKDLGFVTPYYWQRTAMWKHLAETMPGFYNCKDADAALRCFLGIKKDLERNDQWQAFDRHVTQLNKALTYMGGKGLLRDNVMRQEAEEKLTDLLTVVDLKIQAAVPQEARRLHPTHGYKKTPPSTAGLVLARFLVPQLSCPRCRLSGVMQRHVKPTPGKICDFCGQGWTRGHANQCLAPSPIDVETNACAGVALVTVQQEVERWAKPLEFKVGIVGLKKYQEVLGHEAVINRKDRRVTFDDVARQRLREKYPSDPLYPLVDEHSEFQKLLSTYIGITENGTIRGGMPVGKDGRIHFQLTHNPSTLRLSCQRPNMQNLPRPRGAHDLQTIVRNLIVAAPGHVLLSQDFCGIEAILVGYEARSPRYIRLAKLDVHSFYTAYALNALDGRVRTADLPELSWSDERLADHLAGMKQEFRRERNNLYKHLVHGANFFQTPKGAQEKVFGETGVEHPVKLIAKVMDIYFELFPEIRKWQTEIQVQADREGFLRNAFGYIHRFNKVFSYKKVGGTWCRSPGDDAARAVAFCPQGNAAGTIKEAILRLFFNRFEEAGQYLRLQVHDELLNEVPEKEVDRVNTVLKEEMERPISQLPLPVSYGMGPLLTVPTESKIGYRWGNMS